MKLKWDTGRGDAQGEAQVVSQVVVLVVGLFAIVVMTFPVFAIVAYGPVTAALPGVALLAVAWFVPTPRSVRALRYLLAGYGVLSLVGALVHLFI